ATGDAGLAWEPPEKLHYTLKFLGDVAVDELHLEALTHAAEVAAEVAPFELRPRSLGAFPDEGSPRVLWLGAGDGDAALVGLAAKLESFLAGYGYSRETRPYRPHLTLARAKGKSGERALRDLLAEERPERPFGATSIDRFVLMQSTGGEYRVRLTFALGGAA
ncbi:MAG: RNA 2',3'-cyclic phosphodiesterase, partial [Polyangiales bacterium]